MCMSMPRRMCTVCTVSLCLCIFSGLFCAWLSWLPVQCSWFPGKTRLWNDPSITFKAVIFIFLLRHWWSVSGHRISNKINQSISIVLIQEQAHIRDRQNRRDRAYNKNTLHKKVNSHKKTGSLQSSDSIDPPPATGLIIRGQPFHAEVIYQTPTNTALMGR